MTHRVSIVPALLLGTAMWPACALAQNGSAGQSERSASKADETVIVVTATGLSSALSTTKTDAPIIESPQSISIVNRDEMELRAAATIADALSYTAGVQAEPSGIDSRTDEVSVRGFGAGGYSSNNNFVDGLRLPTGGGWTRLGFDTYALEQIEVLKGPSGVLYGQSAPGGMVNLVSKRPTDDGGGELLIQGQGYTDLDNWSGRIAGDIGGALNASGSIRARLVGLAHSGGTQVDDADNSRYYISPSVTWEPGPGTSWTLLAQYQRDEGASTFQFLPYTGAYVPSDGEYLDNSTNIGEPDWNRFDRNQLLVGSFFEHRLSDAVTLRNNTRYTHVDTLFRLTVNAGDTITDCSAYTYDGCIDGHTIPRRAVQGDGESDGFATDTQLEVKFGTGGVEHTLLAGMDYFHTEWEHFRDIVGLPGLPRLQVDPILDIFDPVPRGSDTYLDNMTPQVYGSAVSEQTGVYLQDQLAIGRLRLTVGGRYDWSDDETTDLLAETTQTYQADKFTWRAGAVYLFDNGLAPYFGYSESFLPQLVDPGSVTGGELFEPTTGQQFEGGIRYQGGHNIYVTLGAFQITQQNAQVVDPDPPADEPCLASRFCYIQAGETRVSGLEFEGRATLASGTTIIASATHLDAEFTEDPNTALVGENINQVPEFLASLFVDQKIATGPLEGLSFGGGVRYTGKSWGDVPNTNFPIDDYTLYDVFLRYDLGAGHPSLEGLTASFNMRNLANERYIATCSTYQSCFYGQGRVATARLQYKW